MLRRCCFLGMLALWVGATGCTGPATRAGNLMSARSAALADSPGPPQRMVSLPPERIDSSLVAASSTGLAKYFPGIRKGSVEAPRLAGSARPSRLFSRRSRSSQIYTTDARPGLGQAPGSVLGAEASALPVAIQMPTDPTSDAAVQPTRGEATSDRTPTAGSGLSDGPPLFPGTASAPADEVNPLPPAAESHADEVVAPRAALGDDDQEFNPLPPAAEPGRDDTFARRKPEVPEFDPRERPRLTSGTTTAIDPQDPKPEPSPKLDEPAPEPSPTPDEPAAKPEPEPTSAPGPKADEPEARTEPKKEAGPRSVEPSTQAVPRAMAPPLHNHPAVAPRTSLIQWLKKSTAKPAARVHATSVLASPQSPPPTRVLASPQVKPTPQVLPTPQVKPTPQVLPTSQVSPSSQAKAVESCEAEAVGPEKCHHCCLLKLVKKVLHCDRWPWPKGRTR